MKYRQGGEGQPEACWCGDKSGSADLDGEPAGSEVGFVDIFVKKLGAVRWL